MAFFEVPAARADEEHGGVFDERVVLVRGGVVEGDGAADGVDEIELAVEQVLPGGRGGVFEVGHEDACAGVERVDDHLAVDGAGDLDAAVLQVGGDGRDGPGGFADLACRGEKVGAHAGVKLLLTGDARGEKLLAARVELALECDNEGEGFGGEDARVAVGSGGVDAGTGWEGHGAFLVRLSCKDEKQIPALRCGMTRVTTAEVTRSGGRRDRRWRS